MATRPDLIAGRAFVLIEAVDRTGMALNRISGHLRQWANQMQSIGTIVLKVSIASALPIGYSIKQFAEYENRMSRIAVLMDEPGKHMAVAGDRLRQLAKDYGTPIEQLQAGYQTMVSGGMEPGAALKGMESSAKAARGFRIEVGGVAEAVRRLVMGFRITSDEATDLMFAMDRGGIDAQEMVLQLGMAVPMARAAGLGWKEFGATVAAISTVVPTDQVMTAMKNITSEFLAPSAKGIEMAKKYGFELSVDTLKAKGLGNVIKQVMTMPGVSESQKMEDLAKLFPDVRGLLGVAQIAKNLDTYDQMMKQVENSAGLTNRAWDMVSKDVKTNMDKAWQSIKDIALEVGAKLAPVMLEGSIKVQNLSQKVIDFVKNNQRLIVTITAVTAGMITMGATAVGLALGLRVLVFTTGQLGMLLRLVVAPFYIFRMLLVGVLGTVFALIQGVYALSAAFLVFTFATSPARFGLVALMGLLLYKVYENKAAVAALSDEYSKWWSTNTTGIAGGLAEWFTSMIPKVRALGQTLSTTFFGLTDALMMGDLDAAWTLSLKGMELSWLQMVDMFKSTWEAFIKFFVQAWEGAKQAVMPYQEAITSAIAERMVANPENDVIDASLEAFNRMLGITWEPFAGRKTVGEKERDYVESLKAKRQELYKEIEDIKAELAAQQKIPDPTRALERSAKRIREDVLKDRLAETIASREAIGDELSKIQAGGVPQIPERSRLTREKQRLEGELGTGRLARDTTTRMQKELEEVNRKLYELNKFQETMPSPDAVKRSLKGEPGDDWLAKASADYATKIAAASAEMLGAGGAQDPELFAKQQARIEAMTKLKEELDALRESIRKNREEYDKKEKEKWDNPSMFAAQDRFDRAKKALNNIPDTATFDEILPLSKEYQSALQALNAERSKSTVSGSMDGLIKAFTNNQLGQGLSEAARMLGPLLNMAGAGIMNMTGEQPDYKIPATETIMANSKEAAEFMKKIWQEEHLPASAQTDAQQNAAVRNKLLEILPRINDYLRKIAGAEGV